jgi:hypothetical protein
MKVENLDSKVIISNVKDYIYCASHIRSRFVYMHRLKLLR